MTNQTPESVIAEAMVNAGAPLMHSRVEEGVASALRVANMLRESGVPDAATAALERVRVVTDALRSRYSDNSEAAYFMGQILAALDGAPEPEWEYRAKVEWHDKYNPRRLPNYYLGKGAPFTCEEMSKPVAIDTDSGENTLDGCYLEGQERRRPAGPWLPVEGESK